MNKPVNKSGPGPYVIIICLLVSWLLASVGSWRWAERHWLQAGVCYLVMSLLLQPFIDYLKTWKIYPK